MLTREQILEVDTYCAEHQVSQQRYLDGTYRYWLYNKPVDMRKSFNGLSGIVTNAMSGRLQVVVVRIGRMMRNHNVRLALPDGAFNMLHQLEMGDRVHLYVRELALVQLVHTQVIQRCMRVIVQLLVLRAERACLRLRTHDADIHGVTLLSPFVNRCTSAQHLIIML